MTHKTTPAFGCTRRGVAVKLPGLLAVSLLACSITFGSFTPSAWAMGGHGPMRQNATAGPGSRDLGSRGSLTYGTGSQSGAANATIRGSNGAEITGTQLNQRIQGALRGTTPEAITGMDMGGSILLAPTGIVNFPNQDQIILDENGIVRNGGPALEEIKHIEGQIIQKGMTGGEEIKNQGQEAPGKSQTANERTDHQDFHVLARLSAQQNESPSVYRPQQTLVYASLSTPQPQPTSLNDLLALILPPSHQSPSSDSLSQLRSPSFEAPATVPSYTLSDVIVTSLLPSPLTGIDLSSNKVQMQDFHFLTHPSPEPDGSQLRNAEDAIGSRTIPH